MESIRSEQIERERKAFAATLKSRTALLASYRGPRRSRKRAQTPKTEAESFGAKLTTAIKSRLARRPKLPYAEIARKNLSRRVAAPLFKRIGRQGGTRIL